MRRGALWLALTLCAGPLAAQEGGVAVVHFADGSNVPLTNWSFSYEYHAWKEGAAPGHTQPTKREARELLVGKKGLALAGGRLEIRYRTYEREISEAGESKKQPWAMVTGLVLDAGGKRQELKPDAPHKDLLLPGSKGMVVQARGVDFTGDTLTGTRRSYCLLGFSSLVECSSAPADRVTRIEFGK
jgi:hypothetical protein